RSHARDQAGRRWRCDLVEAEGRYERALVNVETPERLYERQWALTLMAVVLDGLRQAHVTSPQRWLLCKTLMAGAACRLHGLSGLERWYRSERTERPQRSALWRARRSSSSGAREY